MKRRRTLAAIVALGAAAISPRVVAQDVRRPVRVGVLGPGALSDVQERMGQMAKALRELGWVEGKDVIFEIRAGRSDPAGAAALAEELVRMKVDILVTSSTTSALAAKAATRSIPIVFSMVGDPVASGLVTNLARPGANLTGWSNILPETSGKLLELLNELLPGLKRIAVLYDADNQGKLIDLKEIQGAVKDVAVEPFGVHSKKDIGAAFAAIVRDRAEALIVLQDGVTFPNREEIVRLAARHRIPAAYQIRKYVEAGGLLSYGLNLDGQNKRTAAFVDRILKGARPGDLPVERPTHFELFVNAKAARAIGLAIPQSILLRADRVIE